MAQLNQAQQLLERARELKLAKTQGRLLAARGLVGSARGVLERHVGALLAENDRLVEQFDGLPVMVNPISIMGKSHDELAHSSILAWLLDPRANHGLGDAMLRALLGRSDSLQAEELALSPGDLDARVAREVQLGPGIVDLLVVLPSVVASIEVKVFAVEDKIGRGTDAGPQTLVYRQALEDARGRAAALRRFGPDAIRLAGDNPAVLSFFVRPAGRDPAGDGRTTSLDWLDVEGDLRRALQRSDVRPAAKQMIQAFRSTLLEVSGSKPPAMSHIVKLRRLVDRRGRVDPLLALLQLRTVLKEGQVRD